MPASAYVLFGAAVLWCFFWAYKATRSLVFLLILVALGALHSLLAAHGVHADAMVFPPPQMAVLAPVLLSLIVCTLLPAGRRWMRGLPLFVDPNRKVLEMGTGVARHDLAPRALRRTNLELPNSVPRIGAVEMKVLALYFGLPGHDRAGLDERQIRIARQSQLDIFRKPEPRMV